MSRASNLAASLLALTWAGPAAAGDLQFFESTLGAPGVTAGFPNGIAHGADIDFDADSAEGGGLPFGGPTEVEIVPTGDLSFVDFDCHAQGCNQFDYDFTPGGAGVGGLVWSDPSFSAQTGIVDLGLIEFDVPSDQGTLELVGCNYAGGDGIERTCSPFTLVSVPEPARHVSLPAGAALAIGLARRRTRTRPCTSLD